jgi:hypothetical protein
MHQLADIYLSLDAMFLLGAILTLSTIVTFLIVRMLTGNAQLALLSIATTGFPDVQIQWSIQVIAMSLWNSHICFHHFLRIKSLFET